MLFRQIEFLVDKFDNIKFMNMFISLYLICIEFLIKKKNEQQSLNSTSALEIRNERIDGDELICTNRHHPHRYTKILG